MKNLLMITALDIWSMKKKSGAQSLWYTIRGYADNGWRVYFLTSNNSDSSFHNLHKNIHIINLNSKLNRFKSIKYLRFFINPIWWLYFQIGMIVLGSRILRKYRIDLLYGYEVIGVPAAKFLSFIFKKPFVSRFQGTILMPKMKSYFWQIRHWHHVIGLKIEADITIMTNDGTEGDKVLKYLNRDMQKVKFWINGVDKIKNSTNFDYLAYKHKMGFDKDIVTILCVSRLVHWKRVDRIICAMQYIIPAFRNARLLIVGDGPERKNLEDLVSSLSLSNCVIFIGSIPHHEVHKYYSLTDLFVSFYDLSNVGNPLLEAMVQGLCIVTINTGDTEKFIHNEKNGILLENCKIENIAEVVSSLLMDKKKRIRLGAGAKEFAEKNFWSWEDRINAEIETIEKLISPSILNHKLN
jgi:glycosyltransferase involved in cell wall biosynthesis